MPEWCRLRVAVFAAALRCSGGAASQAQAATSQYADPLQTLGATSPTCGTTGLSPTTARNCVGSGSVAHRYPISSYGLDVQVGFSLTHIDRSFLGALQS